MKMHSQNVFRTKMASFGIQYSKKQKQQRQCSAKEAFSKREWWEELFHNICTLRATSYKLLEMTVFLWHKS